VRARRWAGHRLGAPALGLVLAAASRVTGQSPATAIVVGALVGLAWSAADPFRVVWR
jgi:hypothetical protein